MLGVKDAMNSCNIERKTRLAIGTPWDSPFCWRKPMESIIRLTCAFRRPDWELDFFMGHGVMPARRHADLCEQAVAWGADLILILGADQTYSPDMIERLVQRWEQVGGHGIIAAMVPMRGYVNWQPMAPFQPMAWRSPDAWAEVDGQPSLIQRTDGDFVRANIIGTGVVLFSARLLDHFQKPWFYERVDPESMHRVADMDSNFIGRLQHETGTPLYVDTTILVKHCHDFEIDDTFQHRFADWADPTTPGLDSSIIRFR